MEVILIMLLINTISLYWLYFPKESGYSFPQLLVVNVLKYNIVVISIFATVMAISQSAIILKAILMQLDITPLMLMYILFSSYHYSKESPSKKYVLAIILSVLITVMIILFNINDYFRYSYPQNVIMTIYFGSLFYVLFCFRNTLKREVLILIFGPLYGFMLYAIILFLFELNYDSPYCDIYNLLAVTFVVLFLVGVLMKYKRNVYFSRNKNMERL